MSAVVNVVVGIVVVVDKVMDFLGSEEDFLDIHRNYLLFLSLLGKGDQ